MEEKTLNESTLSPIQSTRCKDLFVGPNYEVIKTSVKNQILDTLYNWLKKMGYDYEKVITSIRIEGSSIGFQYEATSDIDVSIISTLSDSEVDKLWKLLPNGQKVKGTEMPINYYLLRSNETETENTTSDIYDLLNDTFTKKTELKDIKRKIPFSYVIEIAKFFTAGVDDRINELEADKTELDFLKKLTKEEISEEERADLIAKKEMEIKADLDSLYVAHCMLKSLRHQAFGKKGKEDGWYPIPIIIELKDTEKYDDPNHSVSNTVYKMVFDKLNYEEKLKPYLDLREKMLLKSK